MFSMLERIPIISIFHASTYHSNYKNITRAFIPFKRNHRKSILVNAHSIVTKTRTPNGYTVATDPKVDMNSLGRSVCTGHLRRNTPADLLSTPIRTHSSKSTNVRPPKRPSTGCHRVHRNSLSTLKCPRRP